jgi:hypothetical protein
MKVYYHLLPTPLQSRHIKDTYGRINQASSKVGIHVTKINALFLEIEILSKNPDLETSAIKKILDKFSLINDIVDAAGPDIEDLRTNSSRDFYKRKKKFFADDKKAKNEFKTKIEHSNQTIAALKTLKTDLPSLKETWELQLLSMQLDDFSLKKAELLERFFQKNEGIDFPLIEEMSHDLVSIHQSLQKTPDYLTLAPTLSQESKMLDVLKRSLSENLDDFFKSSICETDDVFLRIITQKIFSNPQSSDILQFLDIICAKDSILFSPRSFIEFTKLYQLNAPTHDSFESIFFNYIKHHETLTPKEDYLFSHNLISKEGWELFLQQGEILYKRGDFSSDAVKIYELCGHKESFFKDILTRRKLLALGQHLLDKKQWDGEALECYKVCNLLDPTNLQWQFAMKLPRYHLIQSGIEVSKFIIKSSFFTKSVEKISTFACPKSQIKIPAFFKKNNGLLYPCIDFVSNPLILKEIYKHTLFRGHAQSFDDYMKFNNFQKTHHLLNLISNICTLAYNTYLYHHDDEIIPESTRSKILTAKQITFIASNVLQLSGSFNMADPEFWLNLSTFTNSLISQGLCYTKLDKKYPGLVAASHIIKKSHQFPAILDLAGQHVLPHLMPSLTIPSFIKTHFNTFSSLPITKKITDLVIGPIGSLKAFIPAEETMNILSLISDKTIVPFTKTATIIYLTGFNLATSHKRFKSLSIIAECLRKLNYEKSSKIQSDLNQAILGLDNLMENDDLVRFAVKRFPIFFSSKRQKDVPDYELLLLKFKSCLDWIFPLKEGSKPQGDLEEFLANSHFIIQSSHHDEFFHNLNMQLSYFQSKACFAHKNIQAFKAVLSTAFKNNCIHESIFFEFIAYIVTPQNTDKPSLISQIDQILQLEAISSDPNFIKYAPSLAALKTFIQTSTLLDLEHSNKRHLDELSNQYLILKPFLEHNSLLSCHQLIFHELISYLIQGRYWIKHKELINLAPLAKGIDYSTHLIMQKAYVYTSQNDSDAAISILHEAYTLGFNENNRLLLNYKELIVEEESEPSNYSELFDHYKRSLLKLDLLILQSRIKFEDFHNYFLGQKQALLKALEHSELSRIVSMIEHQGLTQVFKFYQTYNITPCVKESQVLKKFFHILDRSLVMHSPEKALHPTFDPLYLLQLLNLLEESGYVSFINPLRMQAYKAYMENASELSKTKNFKESITQLEKSLILLDDNYPDLEKNIRANIVMLQEQDQTSEKEHVLKHP